jgi:hypothetical protein
MRTLRVIFVAVAVTLMGAAVVIGCKQGDGDRCQLTSDCDDGLICGTDNKCHEATPADASPTPDQ